MYKVEVEWHDGGFPKSLSFECETVSEVQQGLLKRLGNITKPNKAARELEIIRRNLRKARTIKQIEEAFFLDSKFEIKMGW